MNVARKLAVAILTATLSIGLVGIAAAPANAEIIWWRAGR